MTSATSHTPPAPPVPPRFAALLGYTPADTRRVAFWWEGADLVVADDQGRRWFGSHRWGVWVAWSQHPCIARHCARHGIEFGAEDIRARHALGLHVSSGKAEVVPLERLERWLGIERRAGPPIEISQEELDEIARQIAEALARRPSPEELAAATRADEVAYRRMLVWLRTLELGMRTDGESGRKGQE